MCEDLDAAILHPQCSILELNACFFSDICVGLFYYHRRSFKGWVGGPYAPKILALPERGGALPLARIFLEDLSTTH